MVGENKKKGGGKKKKRKNDRKHDVQPDSTSPPELGTGCNQSRQQQQRSIRSSTALPTPSQLSACRHDRGHNHNTSQPRSALSKSRRGKNKKLPEKTHPAISTRAEEPVTATLIQQFNNAYFSIDQILLCSADRMKFDRIISNNVALTGNPA